MKKLTILLLISHFCFCTNWFNIQWSDFGKTEVKQITNDGLVFFDPLYPTKLKNIDGKRIRVKGFIMPTSEMVHQTNFLFTPNPLSCGFCGGSDDEGLLFLEVFTANKTGIEVNWDPIVIEGTLELQYGELAKEGLFFRLLKVTEVKN